MPIDVTCNGVPTRVAAGAPDAAPTIADLLTQRLDDPRPHGVAVAVDGEVVPRDDWARQRLAHGAQVEIVTAVQGG